VPQAGSYSDLKMLTAFARGEAFRQIREQVEPA